MDALCNKCALKFRCIKIAHILLGAPHIFSGMHPDSGASRITHVNLRAWVRRRQICVLLFSGLHRNFAAPCTQFWVLVVMHSFLCAQNLILFYMRIYFWLHVSLWEFYICVMNLFPNCQGRSYIIAPIRYCCSDHSDAALGSEQPDTDAERENAK
jgi:hypothetical protein